MKSVKQCSRLYRQSSLTPYYNHYNYGSILLLNKQNQNRFCSNSNSEDRLKQSFLSKYRRKIQKSTTSEAWNRYEAEQKVRRPEQEFNKDFETPEFETPAERQYSPHHVFGIPRATFRGLVISISCLIGATLFVILRPAPISDDKERSNMHYFARLNADPSVHVTYSGLMYKIIEQQNLDNDDTDLHLLTNPNPDIHCVDIEYEGRFIDGTIFDTTFEGNAESCTFAAKSLIAGLHQGLTNMTRESVFEFYLPPHLAYGERGSEFIPPHEPLVFKVKLKDFWKDQHLDRPRRFKLVN